MAGSCGNWHSDDDFVAALGNSWMQGQYKGPHCGRQIEVTNVGSNYSVGGVGNTIIVTVQDTCESCDESHVDFSVGAWNALTDGGDPSIFRVKW